VAGLKSGLYRFDPATGAFSELARLDSAAPDCRINDGAVDSSGHLWFGTLDETERQASGVLYRLDDDGRCRPRDEGYIVTNGPAFSPDGKTLYHTDTLGQTIYAFDLAADGVLSGKRVFARIERPGVYPDGPVVDEEGCLWTGLFGGWGVERYAPSGERLAFIEFPCSRVTKLAFGGPQLGTAYVTTARKGLSAAELGREPDAGAVFAFETETRGLPAPRVAHGCNGS
jgi:sugar lactone lactonase YvrE